MKARKPKPFPRKLKVLAKQVDRSASRADRFRAASLEYASRPQSSTEVDWKQVDMHPKATHKSPKLNYAKYLRSPHWREMVARVKIDRNFTCQRCPARHNLDVHHLTYARVGAEKLADLMLLCNSCHASLHNAQREAEKLAKLLKVPTKDGSLKLFGERRADSDAYDNLSADAFIARRKESR